MCVYYLYQCQPEIFELKWKISEPKKKEEEKEKIYKHYWTFENIRKYKWYLLFVY